jgi:hypothetical protein
MQFSDAIFDSSDRKGGERGSHLNIMNLNRISWMNVHVQRMLDGSRFLGLDEGQLKRRDEKRILGDE